ncbi:MAG: gliding motility-associated C-terminal domain-containing protein [Crocinitomicaceae bacterium]
MKTSYFSFLILIFSISTTISFSQNLVPNPGFEDFKVQNQYIYLGDTSFATTPISCWAGANRRGCRYNHLQSVYSTPDNLPANTQAHSGEGYLILDQSNLKLAVVSDSSLDYRSYGQTKLISPLVAGQVYSIKLYIFVAYSTTPLSYFSYLKNFGIHFSTSRITDFAVGLTHFHFYWPNQIDFSGITFIPNVWTELTATYTAIGGERYMTMGNFDYYSEFVLFNGPPALDPTKILPPCTIGIDDISLVPLGSTNYTSPTASLGPDTTICGTSVNFTLTAASGFDQYIWNTGDTTQSIQVTQPGVYSVNVNNECSLCNDSIVVSLQPPLTLELGNDTLVCVDGSFQFLVAPNYVNLGSYQWSNGENTPQITVNSPGVYSLEADYACGSLYDTIVVVTEAKPGRPDFSDTIVCLNSPSYLPTAVGQNLQWFADPSAGNGSSVAPIFLTSSVDTFETWISQTVNTCESDRFKQTISVIAPPYFDLQEDTTLCKYNDSKFGPSNFDWEYSWNDGFQKSPRVFEETGFYTLTAENQCGSFWRTIEVKIEECPCTMYFPDAITANGDGLNDFLQASYFCELENYELKVYNRWGQIVFRSENPDDQWQIGFEFPAGVYQLICHFKGKLVAEETVAQKLVVLR